MGASHVADILEAAVASLNAEGKPDGAVVVASRVRLDATRKLINVFPVSDSPATERQGNRAFPGTATRRLLVLAVVCRIRGGDAENETLRAWAAQQLPGGLTLAVDGVAGVTEGDTEWRQEIDAKGDYSEAAMSFAVEYVRPKNKL
jgi:hypothetical protein